ncbi:hypothetical protein F8M41_010782 [Gigaspora margarita]|uniref:Uncharacterized protein n=1 Tax=Gigaspora margarita TaxID=4874 RepID=A0A8H4A238_GIGMA|nr:hypothetical protein F8M41_010782 [Gigaspora margarita]
MDEDRDKIQGESNSQKEFDILFGDFVSASSYLSTDLDIKEKKVSMTISEPLLSIISEPLFQNISKLS